MRTVLRVLSAIALGLAISSTFAVLALDYLHTVQRLESWRLESAFPLLFAGISYACLQFASPRSWKERALGLSVGLAFILWGMEQFVPYPAVRAGMDDCVVFLFVLDLSIVIRGQLKAR